MAIHGKYFSWTSASLALNDDLITLAKTKTGLTGISAKKITIIASGSLAIDINSLGVSSTLFQDADTYYKLSLDSDDVLVNSAKITAASGCPVFVAMVF